MQAKDNGTTSLKYGGNVVKLEFYYRNICHNGWRQFIKVERSHDQHYKKY